MDINALRDRLASLNSKTAKKPRDLFKPKDKHTVRLMPYPHGEDPMLVLHFHYDIGNASVYCPKANLGEDCEICDFCDKLRAWKGPDGNDKAESDRKTDWEMFKKIQAKARVFVPCVVRGSEAEGPKFWSITPKQAEGLLKVCSNSDRIEMIGADPADPKEHLRVLFDTDKAFDLDVDFAKPGEKGNTTSFTQVTFEPKIKATPLLSDRKAAQELVKQVKDIKDVYPPATSAEVAVLFKKFVGEGMTVAEPTGGVEKYPSNSNEKLTGTKSIDEAFDEMASAGK